MSNKYLLEYELDGKKVNIEAVDEYGIVRLSKKKQEEANEKFQKAVANVKPVAKAIFEAFEGFNNPKEIQLEFGLKFSGKIGAIFASADSEATFKFTLKWENK